jgi:hypothetical protein
MAGRQVGMVGNGEWGMKIVEILIASQEVQEAIGKGFLCTPKRTSSPLGETYRTVNYGRYRHLLEHMAHGDAD